MDNTVPPDYETTIEDDHGSVWQVRHFLTVSSETEFESLSSQVEFVQGARRLTASVTGVQPVSKDEYQRALRNAQGEGLEP